jgi:hypothetical protein
VSGAASATPCAAGSYQPSAGSTSCLLADIGYYVPTSGQKGETACPALQTTLAPGATSCTAKLSVLLTQVTGVGPGTSFADKITQAQNYVAANDTPDACGTLAAFINQVNAQTGKTITTAQAASFIAQATSVQAALGC